MIIRSYETETGEIIKVFKEVNEFGDIYYYDMFGNQLGFTLKHIKNPIRRIQKEIHQKRFYKMEKEEYINRKATEIDKSFLRRYGYKIQD